MFSRRPYLLRAIYEWLVDNQLTPYVMIDATSPHVSVPERFVEDGKIILNIDDRADFREIGIAVLEEHDPGTEVGPLIVVQDFGRPLDDLYGFVTGVVYQDVNGNRFYDVGEGIEGIAELWCEFRLCCHAYVPANNNDTKYQ